MTETTDNSDPSFPRSRNKKQSNRVLYLFIITILALTGGFFFYQKNLSSQHNNANLEKTENQNSSSLITNGESSPPTDTLSALKIGNGENATQINTQNQNTGELNPKPFDNAVTPNKNNGVNNMQGGDSTQLVESGAEHNSSQGSPDNRVDYKKIVTELNSFYNHLDSQLYMQAFKLPEASKEHFSKLIQKLIENPPVVARETDDLFTLLKNTAHFFRIIGKDNILVLKGILDREKDSFEKILQSLYTLTGKPKLLKEEYSISLDPDALYDYAGFFLNTMGGRLYLFRRDSNSRMAVSFYAIAIIDKANDSGNSRHGIDVRPAIDSLIEEIENGGNNLKMREYYLDTLYDLKVKYD